MATVEYHDADVNLGSVDRGDRPATPAVDSTPRMNLLVEILGAEGIDCMALDHGELTAIYHLLEYRLRYCFDQVHMDELRDVLDQASEQGFGFYSLQAVLGE